MSVSVCMCHVDSQYCTVYVYDDEYVTACTAVSVSCMYCVYLTRRPQTQKTFGRRPRLTHKCHPQAAPLVTAPLTQLALPIQAIDVMAKSGCSGVSVMRAEFDATTTTEVDTHEAQWPGGGGGAGSSQEGRKRELLTMKAHLGNRLVIYKVDTERSRSWWLRRTWLVGWA